MIHTELFSLGQRIIWYKKALVLFLFLNVLSVSAGGVFAYLYFKGGYSATNNIHREVETLNKLSELETHVLSLKNTNKFRDWHKTLNLATGLGMGEDWEFNFQDPKQAPAWALQVQSDIRERRSQSLALVTDLQKNESVQRKSLIWIGALTLIFGIFLPLTVIYLISKALRTAQKMLVSAAREFISDWRLAVEKGGPDAFKNSQFWVEAVLILSHHLGRQMDHPLIQMSGELAGLVQSELKFARKNAA